MLVNALDSPTTEQPGRSIEPAAPEMPAAEATSFLNDSFEVSPKAPGDGSASEAESLYQRLVEWLLQSVRLMFSFQPRYPSAPTRSDRGTLPRSADDDDRVREERRRELLRTEVLQPRPAQEAVRVADLLRSRGV